VSGVLLRPLPFAHPDRLVRLWANFGPGGREADLTFPDFEDLRRDLHAFDGAADWYFGREGLILSGDREPLRLQTAYVSGDFFQVLGVRAPIGRTLDAGDDRRGSDRVVVLSHALWRGRFGADPTLVGRTLQLDGEPFTVVGVAPPDMRFPAEGVQAWAPLSLVHDDAVPHLRGVRWLGGVARLRDGATLDQARREANAFAARLAADNPQTEAGWTAMTVRPLADEILGPVRRPLLLLLCAVGLLLLVACVNVSTLLLARASTRGREMAIRAALGAGRGRLLRQLLVESALLAALGGALGVLLAAWAVETVVTLARDHLVRAADVRLDLPVLAFAVAVSLASGVAAGTLPALRGAPADLAAALRELAGAPGGGQLRAALVSIEVGLATVLVVGAALLVTSFSRLMNVDPGFRPEGALLVRLTLPARGDSLDFIDLYQRLLDAAAAVSGVSAVGAVKSAPLRGDGGERWSFAIGGEPAPATGQEPTAEAFPISPGFFRAMGIPLLAGRDLAAVESSPVAIVSESLAKKHLGGSAAIGRELIAGPLRLRVIGVVGDVRSVRLDQAPRAAFYLPEAIMPRVAMAMVVRSALPTSTLAPALRAAVRSISADLPLTEITTLEEVVSDSVRAPRFLALVMSLFGFAALALAVVGIYGVVAQAVGSRAKEIAIRRALGATGREVIAQAMRHGLGAALVGLAAGLAAALAGGRILTAVLFQTSAAEPSTYLAVALSLAAAAACGSYLPARRAARIEPMDALRAE
jgi:predicted permease